MHTIVSVSLNIDKVFTALKVLKKMYGFFFKYSQVIVAFKGMFKEFLLIPHNILLSSIVTTQEMHFFPCSCEAVYFKVSGKPGLLSPNASVRKMNKTAGVWSLSGSVW